MDNGDSKYFTTFTVGQDHQKVLKNNICLTKNRSVIKRAVFFENRTSIFEVPKKSQHFFFKNRAFIPRAKLSQTLAFEDHFFAFL